MPEGMKIGYARTSTLEQTASLDAQVKALEAEGCAKVFSEQVSSVRVEERHKLAQALEYVREGDTLVVAKLDRLARSLGHLMTIVEELKAKGVSLKIMDQGIDTSSTNGKLILSIFGAVAEFERDCMLDRQREGIAQAKAAGKYKGRKPKAREQTAKVLELQAEGVGPSEIAQRLGIGRSSVYRILSTAQEGQG